MPMCGSAAWARRGFGHTGARGCADVRLRRVGAKGVRPYRGAGNCAKGVWGRSPQGRDGKGRRGRKTTAPRPDPPHGPLDETAAPVRPRPPGHPRHTPPEARRRRPRCETCRMPVLDPNPQNGQKKMLLVFGAFFAIFIVIGVIATVLAP
ncbi:hypothetical protein GCM10010415_51500 [Streptomyces atrovirens]